MQSSVNSDLFHTIYGWSFRVVLYEIFTIGMSSCTVFFLNNLKGNMCK